MNGAKPILLITGVLLAPLGAAMILPALADLIAQHPDAPVFLASAALTLICAVTLIIANWGPVPALSIRQAFLLTAAVWIVLAAFAALPFLFGSLQLSGTDAFFEAMSGLTTTGSTIITELQNASPGLLLWRALLQWMGGIGIIVTAIAVLPMLQIGGMQLFRIESSDASEKILPRAAQLAGHIALIYVALSAACALLYLLVGMNPFDSLAHAMTTIATGGFSTHNASFAAFNSPAIETVAILFMILGSLPFALYLQAMRGHLTPLAKDDQVRWFLTLLAIAVAILAFYGWVGGLNPFEALRRAAFNVVSVATGTGYASSAYDQWGAFPTVFFFLLLFAGGCAGSTSCGMKTFRIVIAARLLARALKRIAHPHALLAAHYNARPISENVAAAVMNFLFLYVLCWIVIALLLELAGLDLLTALSAAAAAISNVGPALGHIAGPSGSFAPFSDPAKWLLAAAMLIGRLELFTVLVLFTPAFWRA